MIINKNKQSTYIIITIIILIFFSSIKLRANDAFYAKGHIMHDLKLDILWLRCSVGQVWNSKKNSCDGKAIKLKMDQIDEVIIQANNQLGGFWRLPTRKELENFLPMHSAKIKSSNLQGTGYHYGVYFDRRSIDASHSDVQANLVWGEWANSKDAMELQNQNFADNFQEVFEEFDKLGTCLEEPDAFNSWMLYTKDSPDDSDYSPQF